MNADDVIVLLIIIGIFTVPALIVYAMYCWLNPTTYWERLAFLMVGMFVYVGCLKWLWDVASGGRW